MIRKPAVAGQFYSANPQDLKRQLQSFLPKGQAQKEDAIACVLPHAGYMYSGAVATRTAAHLIIKDNIVLLGPNHTGIGSTFSVFAEGAWQTPLGVVNINTELAQRIIKNSPLIKNDTSAHEREHSLEVELPILQFVGNTPFQCVPIVLTHTRASAYQEIGKAIAQAITELGLRSSTLIVASSDMTHYEPHDSAKKKDATAIEAILKLDENLLLERVQDNKISMCGVVPVAVALIAAKQLGARTATLIQYQTSGEVSGDYDQVVGYAGIVIV